VFSIFGLRPVRKELLTLIFPVSRFHFVHSAVLLHER
jgi:hypothetical protein